MRDPTKDELEELAALAFMYGRTVRRECMAGRCGHDTASMAACITGHVSATLAVLIGPLEEPTPQWVLDATKRTKAKAEAEAEAMIAHAGPMN